MLRVLRRPGSIVALRRLMAFVLGVVLLAGCVEPLLADSCDGDAPRAAASTVVAHTEGGLLVAGRIAGAVAGLRSGVSPSGDVIAADVSSGGTRNEQAPQHSVHVCHCTHAHGGALSDRFVLSTRTHPVAREGHERSDRLPPSPALEPHLRPPVLPHAA